MIRIFSLFIYTDINGYKKSYLFSSYTSAKNRNTIWHIPTPDC